MPPPMHIRTPDIFMIPSNPCINWSNIMICALIILDVSTVVGEYHSAIRRSTKYGNIDSKDGEGSEDSSESAKRRIEQRRVCKVINTVALQTVAICMIVTIALAWMVMQHTRGMDGRMILVLEGVSRLEAAHLLAFISVKTPRWIGIYHSPNKARCIAHHIDEGILALKFHVRYTLAQYLLLMGCIALPFAGTRMNPITPLLGFLLGFIIELLIVYARQDNDTKNNDANNEEKNSERKFRVAVWVAVFFAFASSIMFADGCHYIQVVWGDGLYFSEWGLGIATFFASFTVILSNHFYHLQRTVREFYKRQQISTNEKEEKLAISLIKEHFFGSLRSLASGESQRGMMKEEMNNQLEKEDGMSNGTVTTKWSLFKRRLFAPNDLVLLSKFEYYVGSFIGVASIFIVIVNIGATKQMDIVRTNFHSVHDAIYGQMDEGPVCAFHTIGGTVTTFPNAEDARSNGYTIAHCGACGECSTWPNLRLQYTTRNYLARESARCAKKSFLHGRDAVHSCLMTEPIGFSDECATCWTTDIYCARSHCAFIFLQSNMINTVSNFQVGEDTITAATCEEAMCELDFVPCSGANRRRMNITSSIARPGQQLCNILDVEDWDGVFGEGGSYYQGVISTSSEGGGGKDEL